jgi:DNA-binding response OmpR family regulator
MQILIAQSDSALATFLRKSLEAEGYRAGVVDETCPSSAPLGVMVPFRKLRI